MPSTHDPGQLLEPSNLLEPIDLTDEGAIGSIHASTRPDGPRISQSRRTRATSSPPGRKGGERWSLLKPVLVVAGALACFGAGTTVPQLQILMLFRTDAYRKRGSRFCVTGPLSPRYFVEGPRNFVGPTRPTEDE